MEHSFRFKQFEITQQLSAMKIGTDGILLGSWAPLAGGEQRILDVGTGTGLLALMLAQRTENYIIPPYIDAVEIDINAASEARYNCEASRWSDRIAIHNQPFQSFAQHDNVLRYDLVISNPPYFIADSHRDGKHAISQPARIAARHASSLSYADLIDGAVRVLEPQRGALTIILPSPESDVFAERAALVGLYPADKLMVRTTPLKAVRRIVTRYTFDGNQHPTRITQLIVSESGSFTDQFRDLTADFYTKLG